MKAGNSIKGTCLFLSALLFIMASHRMGWADELTAHRLIADAVARFQTVADYTCRLNKKVRKGDVLYEDRDISVKYKKPRHYYFRWNNGVAKGREVIFVQGRHDDRLVAHPGGIFKPFTLRLEPEGYLAMRENRHSLKDSGMEKIINLMESDAALADTKGLDVIRFVGEMRLDGRRVRVVEGRFPEGQGFYAHRIRLHFSPAIQLPLKVSIYDGSGQLVEDYEFHELRINVGLTEHDFDPHNPQYDYAKVK